jgi:LEA14-like dessication related protein
MKKVAVCVAAAMAAGLGACSMLARGAFQQPIVHLQSVAVRGLGLTGGSLDVKLSVYNPNHYRLDATQLTYQVNLAGDSVKVASGTYNSRFTVQDNDSAYVTLPVDFSYAGVGAAGRQAVNTGLIAYHVLGNVTVGSAVGNFTVPFSTVGRFTTTGMQR